GITVFVSIETGDHSQDWLKRFADVVGAMPEVMEFYRMAGDVDYMLRVVVPDIAGYDAFYKKLIATVPLKNVTSRFAMERIKSTTALPIAEVRLRSAWPDDLLQRHHLDDGRSKNDDKQHRQEKENHRHGELRRQSGRLFLGFRHTHVAVFLRHHTQHGSERRAVALGLLQGHADRFHAIEIRPLREILVGLAPVGQIGQFGGCQGELFRERDRLGTDFVTDFPEGCLDRHARFDADQEQVERVRESPFDGQLTSRDLVLEQHERQLHADIGRANTDTELDRGRLIKFEQDKQVDQGEQKAHDGRHHPDEKVGNVGSLATIGGLYELEARLFLTNPLAQVELVDDPLDVLLGRLS